MLQKMTRRAWLLVMIAALLLALPLYAQDGGALTSDTSITGVLDDANLIQVYTINAEAGDTLALEAGNVIGVPLAVVVTNEAGEGIASVVDTDIDGVVTLEPVTLEDGGTYYITVFKAAGLSSVSRVEFSLTAMVSGVETTPELTEQVEPTAQPTAEPTAVETPEATDAVVETAELTPEATETVGGFSTGQVITTTGLSFALTWDTTDDLDLEVRDPVGGSLYWETPTVESGGTISPNVNQQCAVTTDQNPTETASWTPGGIPTGSYELLVYYQQACAGENPVTFTIDTNLDGQVIEQIRGTLLPGQVYVASVRVNEDGTAEFTGLSGVVTDELPAGSAEIISNAQPISEGETVEGVITSADPYDSYSFQGEANDLVSISMEAISGSLDTFLFLLDSTGTVLNLNDDRADGITDAQLVNALLPATGTYTIVATRYGKRVGGTEGAYALTLGAQEAQLPEEFANLPRGTLEIRLLWNTNSDVQLLVRDPAGNAVYDDTPTIRSGGILEAAGNVNCTLTEGTPFSYIYWPTTTPPRPGTYEVEVWFQDDCGDPSPVTANLFVTYNGQEVFSDTFQPLEDERYLTSFTINANGQAVPSEGGIVRGLEDFDYVEELEAALAILPGEPRNGSITQDNKFDVYVFTASAGDVVSIAMNNTSGTLDPLLYLVGPLGSQVAVNDDVVPGENTNALISDLTLPADGQYIIIATHFGGRYGGTTGTYSLTLTRSNQ